MRISGDDQMDCFHSFLMSESVYIWFFMRRSLRGCTENEDINETALNESFLSNLEQRQL